MNQRHKGADNMKRNWNRPRRPGGHHKPGRHAPGASRGPGRAYDSVGPEVKLRGKADQIYKKYQMMARDVRLAGDRVRAESLLQHAEHYYRLMGEHAPQAAQELAADGIETGETGGIEVGDDGYGAHGGADEAPINSGEAVKPPRTDNSGLDSHEADKPPRGAVKPPRINSGEVGKPPRTQNGYEHDGAEDMPISAEEGAESESPAPQGEEHSRTRRRGPLR